MRTGFIRFGLAILIFVVMLAISRWDSDAQVPLQKFEDPTPGRIIERVVCKNNSEQTYALYLPSSYSNSRLSGDRG